MSIEVYHPAPPCPDEIERDQAVLRSGALLVMDDPLLDDIVARARRLFSTRMAAISIIHRDWQYLIAAAGLPSGPYGRRTSFCGHVIARADAMLCVPDTLADERFASNPIVGAGLLVRFYAGVALVDDDGFAIGALCVFDPRPHDCLNARAEATFRELGRAAMARLADRRVPPVPYADRTGGDACRAG